MAWRYYVRRLEGDGRSTPLAHGIPFSDVGLEYELSGPGGFDAEITPARYERFRRPDGQSLFLPWSSAIFSEKDGVLRHGCIVTEVIDSGPRLKVSGVGFTGYATRQPFTGDYSGIDVDPLDAFRMLWEHLQGKIGGNIGLQVDQDVKSPVRRGKAVAEGETTTSTDGPYTLGWWQTHDITQEMDRLTKETPFDYRESHEWDGENVKSRLELGYPSLGRRRTDLRFIAGENVFAPDAAITYDGEEFADEVFMLGAGEGRKMVLGVGHRPHSGRLRRAVVVTDKSIQDNTEATRAAAEEVSYRLGEADLSTFEVRDHPNAPLGSYAVGDEIQVKQPTGFHGGLDLWVRIVAMSVAPAKNTSQLTVMRSEKGLK